MNDELPLIPEQEFVNLLYKIYGGIVKWSLENPKFVDLPLLDQLRRSTSSILLNYCEGIGYKSKNQYLRFLRISRGSAFEARAAINLIPALSSLYGDLDTICAWKGYSCLQYDYGVSELQRKAENKLCK